MTNLLLSTDSKLALWTLDAETAISYGNSERQKIDIFHKKGAPKEGSVAFYSVLYLSTYSGYLHKFLCNCYNISFFVI